MKRLLFAGVGLLTAFPAFAVAQISATPTHFRWSEAQAHELDYHRTIGSSPDLSGADKAALTNAVVQELKRDRGSIDDLTEKQMRVLAAKTRIELVDLRGDGKSEIIAQANGLGPCGGTGNCVFWIFERTAGGLKTLLNTNDSDPVRFEKILIRPWSTNGYRDIVLGSHSSASSRNLVWLQYERGAYRTRACYYSTWTGDDGRGLHTPAIWPEDCSKSLGPLH